MVITYPGRTGAFAEEAALHLAPGATLLPVASVPAAFAAVGDGRASRAVVAIENSLGGSVGPTVDALMVEPVVILAEQRLRIAHVLAGPPGARLEEVRRVHSHPIALAQCRRFFAERPRLEPVPARDTATAIADVVQGFDPAEAALGSRRAAILHGAEVLAADVQDAGDNRTRFLLVAREGEPHATARGTKTTLVIALPHVPGALARALTAIASCGLDLARIDARPSGTAPFEYLFQLDVVGEAADVERATTALTAVAVFARSLGRYAVRDA